MRTKRMASQSRNDGLKEQIEGLANLSYAKLVAQWTKYIGRPPPKSASRVLLARAIAYSLQERHFGGLSKSTLKVLLKHAQTTDKARVGPVGPNAASGATRKSCSPSGTAATPQPMKAIPVLRPGVRLVREWQGKSHSVEVREDGFKWNGKIFGSLSAVATAITGARWSGPRFFSL